jgi:hypothetical protein
VTNEKAPPDDEGKQSGQEGGSSAALAWNRPTPADPIGRQQTQPYGDEIFLEIKKTHRVPMTVAFKPGLDIDLEGQVDDRADERGRHVKNDDCIGERRRRYGAEASEKGPRPRSRRRPCRERLVSDRAQ